MGDYPITFLWCFNTKFQRLKSLSSSSFLPFPEFGPFLFLFCDVSDILVSVTLISTKSIPTTLLQSLVALELSLCACVVAERQEVTRKTTCSGHLRPFLHRYHVSQDLLNTLQVWSCIDIELLPSCELVIVILWPL